MARSTRSFAPAQCRRRIALAAAVVCALVGATVAPAAAQLAAVSNSSSSNSCGGGNNGDRFCGFSAGFSEPSNGTTFRSRYAWNINADVAVFSTVDQSGSAAHRVSFTATAPGAYRLDIATDRNGDMNRREDDIVNGCDGASDTTGVTGTVTTGPGASGSLGLGDPGAIGNGSSTTSININQSSSATITNTSNGSPVSHALQFTWSGSVRSNSCEAAVRQGLQNGSTTDCDACGYTGSPSRTLVDDGHFVRVTLTSFCGNGTVDGSVGETCDQGAANGTTGSCCNSNCTLKSGGTVCRASAGVCDPQETCNGSSPTCPSDTLATSGVCRASAGVCDVAESCNGSGPSCPANQFQPSSTPCRVGVDCDATEFCTGSSASCPADQLKPASAVCRPVASDCDAAENCTGSSPTCPADLAAPATTVCRGSAGPCDAVESCDGASFSCPADGFLSTGICRAAAGSCDVAETCDGSGPGCGPDIKVSAGETCRSAADVCDVAETCDGIAVTCPADEIAPAGQVCRPAVDVCDVEEQCDGASVACPADELSPDADGDSECDLVDNCDDIVNPGQEDGDNDGLGNACDPCTNTGSSFVAKKRVIFQKMLLPIGDDKMSFKGEVLVPTSPTIDPVANGVRVIIENGVPATMLDLVIPGGAYNKALKTGWKRNTAGTRFVYSNGFPTLASPIQSIALSTSARTPGLYKFSMRARNGNFRVLVGETPPKATLVIDSPSAATGQCGEATFPSAASCRFNRSFSAVTCK